jgi:hypothetical protein
MYVIINHELYNVDSYFKLMSYFFVPVDFFFKIHMETSYGDVGNF